MNLDLFLTVNKARDSKEKITKNTLFILNFIDQSLIISLIKWR